jgi:glycerophosphoryl diester phosphodiesterase
MIARPLVIAHRGASGYLPEHTLESKVLAFALGADFVEQDVVATRDGALVVLHDLYLDDVTDVALRFPDRRRADGRHYVVDFDLEELRTLRIAERRAPGSFLAKYPQRFPADVSILRIATLDEELALVKGLNKTLHRSVGIYPEIKHPQWHREQGIDLAAAILDTLTAHGYASADDAVFVQCFDAVELARVRRELGSALKLVQLVGPEADYAGLLTEEGVERVASYANALGPHYSQLVRGASGNQPSALVALARAHALDLHPYTFRRDDLPDYATSLEQLLETFFVDIGVDGVFCDHPDVAVCMRDSLLERRR